MSHLFGMSWVTLPLSKSARRKAEKRRKLDFKKLGRKR